mmetsp:Transcript_30742/g.98884  ORF Transcript_30742/g.98884 Transcript_30742/m.98884 type:complete len:278 (-) Transcript_30742:1510-2343(-)
MSRRDVLEPKANLALSRSLVKCALAADGDQQFLLVNVQLPAHCSAHATPHALDIISGQAIIFVEEAGPFLAVRHKDLKFDASGITRMPGKAQSSLVRRVHRQPWQHRPGPDEQWDLRNVEVNSAHIVASYVDRAGAEADVSLPARDPNVLQCEDTSARGRHVLLDGLHDRTGNDVGSQQILWEEPAAISSVRQRFFGVLVVHGTHQSLSRSDVERSPQRGVEIRKERLPLPESMTDGFESSLTCFPGEYDGARALPTLLHVRTVPCRHPPVVHSAYS